MPPKVDITGQRFGRLVAVKPTDRRSSIGSIVWKCKCDCGNTAYVPVSNLRCASSKTRSCGCGKHENYVARTKPNKHSKTGVRGVFLHKDGYGNVNGYYVQFRGKYLGMFDNIGDATECYLRNKEEYLKTKGAVV